jgi:hypothetical protein
MKRNIIVEKLIKEGLSETTLVKLTDKQLNQLAERMLGEDLTTTADAMQKSPQIQQLAKTPGQNIKLVGEESKKSKKCEHCGKDMSNCSCDDSHMDEELKGKQKNIDKNHNGKIDAEDFKLLNKEKEKKGYVVPKPPIPNFNGHKKETPKETKEGNKFSGELAKAKSQHKDTFNVDGKKYNVEEGKYHDERSEKALEKAKEDFPQLKNVKKCEHCGKVMSKCKCDERHLEENHETKKWVNNLAENNLYHSFTSKNEIMELIKTKLNESDIMTNEMNSDIEEGQNRIPEFMTYDAITSSGPTTAPTKPRPTTKPGTKPGTKPSTPYTPKPGPNHNPKALAENK